LNEEGCAFEKTDAKNRFVKGDHRIIVTCDEIEEFVFGSRFDPTKVYGRRKNRKSRAITGPDGEREWRSVDMESSEESESEDSPAEVKEQSKPGPMIRPPQNQSEVNFSVGGERGKAERVEESAADIQKKMDGQKQAEEREMVRRAARRAVVFGLTIEQPSTAIPPSQVSRGSKHKKSASREEESVPEPAKRKCEALMNNVVVEPSFAKGNWSIRWRE
jgi:DNA polymerase III gamma/tau subunit